MFGSVGRGQRALPWTFTADSDYESEMETAAPDYDYCVTPAMMVIANEMANKNEALHRKIRELQHQLEVLQLRTHFSIQCLAVLDEDICFYTRLFYKAFGIALHRPVISMLHGRRFGYRR